MGLYFVLFLMLVFFACFSPGFAYNEIDVLPSVKQFANRSWLPTDWYLNLQVGYRNLFNGIVGPLFGLMDFLPAAYVARLILYTFIAGAYLFLTRSLGLNMLYATAVLAVFLYQQSLAAGEWIVGGVETKAVSYGFVLLAIGFFIRNRYRFALASLGLAFSFHVLVGLYATFCVGVALIGTGHWKSIAIPLMRNAWIFVLLGFNGFLFCYSQLMDASIQGTQQAWREYVIFRVPHHAMPDAWKGIRHIVLAPLLLGFTILGATSRKYTPVSFLAWHSIGCLLLICIGFLVYFFLDESYLKYYFFRYSDVMLFLGVALMIALSWQEFLSKGLPDTRNLFLHKLSDNRHYLLKFTQITTIAVSAIALLYYVSQFEKRIQLYEASLEDRQDRHEMAQWIQDHTARTDQFLIDPTYGAFYIEAQRPAFVTFKHVPQSSVDIQEWLHRFRLINSGELVKPGGFRAMTQLRENYLDLKEHEIQRLVQDYQLRYFLTSAGSAYSYPAVFSNQSYVLYELNSSR